MTTISLILLSVKLSIIAFCYSDKLTEAEMILGPVKRLMNEAVGRWPGVEWILKPLLICPHCVAGQMALWTCVLYLWLGFSVLCIIINYAFFISLTILLIDLLIKLKQWLNS